MPKQADIRVQVPGTTAARFWDVVYENPAATERYHTRFNASTATSVTPWSTSCQRTVSFTMPVAMPDFVKRMVGLDSVAVTEVQRVVWQGAGSFTVTSETQISNVMGAGRFTTGLQLTVTELHQQGEQAAAQPVSASSSGLLQLVYGVRCAASSIPWPMSATIENLMAEKALVSMQTFLDYCMQLLEEEAEAAAAEGAIAAAASDVATPAAALEPSASMQPGCTTPAAANGVSPGPFAGAAAAAGSAPLSPPTGGLGPCRAMGSGLRHRWPSITCSQDIGPAVGAGADPFLLRRQDTQGGGDTFWDAPDTFGPGVSASGASSGGVSPRQTLQSGTLRRASADHAVAAPSFSGGVAAPSPPPAASVAAVAAAAAETHHVAITVDRLTTSVAALEGKLDKLLMLQQQQDERHQALQQSLLLLRSSAGSGAGDTVAAAAGPAGVRQQRSRGRRWEDSGSASDARWLLRVAIALLLATCLLVGFWVLRPHATGYGPHGGGSGGDAPSSPMLQASVIRVQGVGGGAAAAAAGGLVGGGGGGGHGVAGSGVGAGTGTGGGHAVIGGGPHAGAAVTGGSGSGGTGVGGGSWRRTLRGGSSAVETGEMAAGWATPGRLRQRRR